MTRPAPSPEFLSSLSDLGPIADILPGALAAEPSVAVRLNPSKPAVSFPEADGSVPWCPGGLYLSGRPRFTMDPALHQGRYYVQDASSMFVSRVIAGLTAGSGPLIALDACAAPGGKTTAAIDALPPGSVMVANEIVPRRAAILKENIIKWGSPRVIVTRADTAGLARAFSSFDLILADVPCSGEGMMRKDPQAVGQWTPALVAECADRQRLITANLWQALRPGGIMIYSTCTFNRLENEQIIHHIATTLGGEPIEIPVDPSWGITPGIATPHPCLRFIPGLVRGEGLFVCAIRKPGQSAPAIESLRPARRKHPAKPLPGAAEAARTVSRWISGDDWQIEVTDSRINAIPADMAPLADLLARHTDIIHHGIMATNLKGRDIIPSQALALSTALRPDAFPTVDIDRDTALSYLRRDAITLPADTPRGLILLRHDGAPLGFAKHLGSRTNNLYPPDWRILSRQ